MKLTGAEIERQMSLGQIVIDPFDPAMLNPNSVNLTLSDQLLVYVFEDHLDARKQPTVDAITIPPEGFVFQPNRLYLASTNEYTETHQHVPCIDGRSSFGRLGVLIHLTAGFGDIGFKGTWTLEIMVVHPVRLYAGLPICQISYEHTFGTKSRRYEGRYQGQRGPVPYRPSNKGVI